MNLYKINKSFRRGGRFKVLTAFFCKEKNWMARPKGLKGGTGKENDDFGVREETCPIII
jgi:hypothetical protein